MQPVAQLQGGKVSGITGRKSEGQEAVIKLDVIKDKIDYLVKLFGEAADAKTFYSDAIKNVAEASGLNAGALRKFVSAKASEKFDEKKRDAQQLSLLFEEIEG